MRSTSDDTDNGKRVSAAGHGGCELPPKTRVLIVGAGPVGMITSLQLAQRGIENVIVERNLETTRWPKMDITNVRSMELLRKMGLAGRLRKQGVPEDHVLDCLFSTGLSEGGELITKWDLPSPKSWREKIRENNDGSMPREPYQRCSQAVFEAWLRPIIEAEPLSTCRFGMKFESLRELDDIVESTLTDTITGQQHMINSKYVIGCDGAGSRVRKGVGIEMIGGPAPMAMLLVHFKSRDLEMLHKQGRFWHIFFTNGGIIISQDEKDTWTAHLPIPLDSEVEKLDPEEAVYEVLGGSSGKHRIKIDKILVKSSWRPNLCLAERYRTRNGRVFLAGDSAHQNIPFGGYGMNTGLGDAFDIGWKLAAVLKGYGGELLLESYESERRPVAVRNVDMSGVHTKVHIDYIEWVRQGTAGTVVSDTEQGKELRDRIRAHVLANDGENQDQGIEMGYRNHGSPVVLSDQEHDRVSLREPEWNVRDYIPSTWPGARAPHVFLADGNTSVHDLFGPEYTLVDFTPKGEFGRAFVVAASRLNVPLTFAHIPNETHARAIWERDVVLIRPDDHVAWRSERILATTSQVPVEEILLVSTGRKASSNWSAARDSELDSSVGKTFTGAVENVKQDAGNIALLGSFQQ